MSDQPTPADKARTMAQVQPIIEAAEQAATGIIAEAEAKAKRFVEESRQSTEKLATERAHDMWALTDDLIARAEAVRRQSDELLKALNQTRRGAESALRAGPGKPASPEPQAPPAAPRAAPPPVRPLSGGTAPVGSVKPVATARPGAAASPVPQPAAQPARPPAPSPPQQPAPAPAPPQPPPAADVPAPPQSPPAVKETPKPPARKSSEPSEGARLLATQMAVAGSTRDEISSRLRNDFGIEDAEPMLDMILGEG